MSLDVRSLEKARELANGIIQARCPACGEGGNDRAGEHLRVYPDGRFGCCVFPKDREHRKRIFALAGDKAPRTFSVKVAGGQKPTSGTSVASSLANFHGTLGTENSESVSTSPEEQPGSGTLGTPVFIPYAYTREQEEVIRDDTHICKGTELPVPSVPSMAVSGRLPYLTPGGVLGIPIDSPERFHWWKGGQSVEQTRTEVEQRIREAAGKECRGTSV